MRTMCVQQHFVCEQFLKQLKFYEIENSTPVSMG